MSSYSFYGYSKESTAPNSPGNQDSMGSSMSPGADGQSLGSPGANSTSEGVRNICMLVHHDDCSSLCLFDGSNGANFYALIRLADITAVSLIQYICNAIEKNYNWLCFGRFVLLLHYSARLKFKMLQDLSGR
jgi:hypothetical protein